MTPEVVRRCIRVRKQLVRRANAEYEVTRGMVCQKARAIQGFICAFGITVIDDLRVPCA